MGKKPKKPKDSAGRHGWWRVARPVVAALLTLVFAAGILVALGWVGDESLRRIGPRDRYRVRFSDIQCDTPPGVDRATFLAEVRYAGNFPESFNALDAGERDKLAAAFAAHPWVEAVDGVTAEPQTVVRVRLKFRTPVLAVRVADGSTRQVDGGGVLLPETGLPSGVPALVNLVAAPRTPPGKPWDDDTVKRAVELAKAYHPERLELLPTGWRLTQPDGRILHVPR